ncbi:helix-turn-helix transcriptional regulator [Alkaliphilus transvaalensis]|uniref:helix-turn-helix transcriptional regulator n=1 Tax=Alkaliphilus transvaalensis TaxID=114628 RepID=UPI000478F92C|nr:WYL domain-containing protein [Alkaliphilus transvaalensis]
MGEIKNKQRIIDLLNILKEETDEINGITLNEIKDILEKRYGMNYKIDSRVLRDDIEILKECGYDINERTLNHNKKAYNMRNRVFELHELRLLVDALASAKFIDVMETRQLIKKIKTLTSKHNAKKLQTQIYLDGRVKLDNNYIIENSSIIHDALIERRKITFQYGAYNANKKFNLRRNGDYYYAIPYRLVWSNDFYYLIAKEKRRGITSFRVDRMRNVQPLDDTFPKPDFDIAAYLKKTFNMFPGENVDKVKIEFNIVLLNAIIDKFGLDAYIRPISEEKFILMAEVAINDGFMNWILNWGSRAKVIEPQYLVDKIKEEIIKMTKNYGDSNNN